MILPVFHNIGEMPVISFLEKKLSRTDTKSDFENRFLVRNIIGITGVEMFWGLGLPVLFESTFLQIFLANMGAGSRIIGLIPAILSIGSTFFSLIAAYLTVHLVRKKKAVILASAAASLPLILYGIILFFSGRNRYFVQIFLCFYVFFSLAIGFVSPVWQNFTVKLFSEKKMFPAISVMMIGQTLSKIIGSVFIFKFVEAFSFSSKSASLIFLSVGLIFLFSSFLYVINKEVPDSGEKGEIGFKFNDFLRAVKKIFQNRNFILFLLSTVESAACVCIISFYANYATEYCGINPASASGLFMVFIYIAGIICNIVFGWFDLCGLKTKIMISKISALIAVVILMLPLSLAGFLVISFFLGASRGISLLVFSPTIKKLSGNDDATTYFSVSSLIIFPFGFVIPVLSGIFLDNFSSLKGDSFRYLFVIMGGLIAVSLALIPFVKFERRE
jgi:MFS family permease